MVVNQCTIATVVMVYHRKSAHGAGERCAVVVQRGAPAVARPGTPPCEAGVQPAMLSPGRTPLCAVELPGSSASSRRPALVTSTPRGDGGVPRFEPPDDAVVTPRRAPRRARRQPAPSTPPRRTAAPTVSTPRPRGDGGVPRFEPPNEAAVTPRRARDLPGPSTPSRRPAAQTTSTPRRGDVYAFQDEPSPARLVRDIGRFVTLQSVGQS